MGAQRNAHTQAGAECLGGVSPPSPKRTAEREQRGGKEVTEIPTRKFNYWKWMRKKALAVLLFSVLYVSAWVYVLSIRIEVGLHFHSKVPLMLISPLLIPFMVCFILSLWVLAFHENRRVLLSIAPVLVITVANAVAMAVCWTAVGVSMIGIIVAVLVIALLLSRGREGHKKIVPLGVWLVAALYIVAGYSAMAPALLMPELSRILNVPEISYIPNALLFAFGISLLITAFGVTTMKKRWFYTTIALSALSIGVFSWISLFSLFPIPIFYPAWLIAVSPWPVEIPVTFYLIWKRAAFLKAKG